MHWEKVALLWSLIFAINTARYLIGVGLVSAVLLLCFRAWSRRRRIQSRQPRGRDVRREIFYSLLTTAVYATVGVVTIMLYRTGVVEQPWKPHRYGWLYTIAAIPLLLVLHDAYFYWTHRAMHMPFLFRHFHHVHHRSRTPTPWAAYAFAPGEAFVMGCFVPIASYLLPLPQTAILVFMATMILRNAMGHSGIEFHPRRWIDGPLDLMTTTTHHDLHHQRVRGNYGLYFTWWDRWMGTEFPDYHEQFRRSAEQGGRETVAAIGQDAARLPLEPPGGGSRSGASVG